MILDLITISLTFLVVTGGLSIFLFVVWRTIPDTAGVGWWAAGHAVVALGFAAVSLRGQVSDWISVFGGNGLLVGASILLLMGSAALVGRPLPWRLGLGIGVLFALGTLGLVLVDLLPPRASHAPRAVLGLICLALLAAAGVREMLAGSTQPGPLRRPARLIAGVFTLQAGLIIARIIALLIDPHADPLRPNPGQAVGMMLNLVMVVAWVVGLMGIVEGRRRQALEGEIAARRQAETSLRLRTGELGRSNAELEQFAYVVSHDLRQPLRMVSSYLTLLERRLGERLGSDEREFIGYARSGAKRMDGLILDLLAYARVGRHGAAEEEAVSLAAIAQAVADLLPPEDRAALTVHPPLPTVMASPSDLNRLVSNLVGNALKYRHPDRPPRVALSAAPIASGPDGQGEAGGWVLSVRDNGIGIPANQSEAIFRIFQRLHTDERYEGSGIGLAICRKVVESLGGRIWVDSREGEGSTFHAYFPAARITPPVAVAD